MEDFEIIEKKRLIYREMVRNEETLIHQRLTWLIQIQAFLLAGRFAVVAVAIVPEESIKELKIFLALIGFVSALFILAALKASVDAFRKIDKEWRSAILEGYKGPDIFGLPPDFSKWKGWQVYLSAENMIPVIFMAVWFLDAVFFCSVVSLRTLGIICVIGAVFAIAGVIYFNFSARACRK